MLIKKTSLNIFKIVIVSILAVLFLNFTGTVAKAETTNDETVTLTGYLIDEHCFVNKSDAPGKDTKDCLLMKGCIKGGYGIAVPQTDGSYKFYYFNGKFFTDVEVLDGTEGQKSAYDLIVASSKKDHLAATVTGTLEGITKPSVSLKEVSYPVVDVVKLVEATDVEVANLENIINNSNIQNKDGAEEHKTGDCCILIKYIGIVLAVLVVLGVAVVLISKKIKKAK